MQFLVSIAVSDSGPSRDLSRSSAGAVSNRGLGGIGIPTQFITTDADWVEGRDGYELKSEMLLERLERFLTELLSIASRLGEGER